MASDFNFSDSAPAAPAGQQNIKWQADGSSPTNVSAYDPLMIGDGGSGGKAGNVPPPAAGDALAGKFLRADGAWAVPSGSSSGGTGGSFTVNVNSALVASSASGSLTFNVNGSLIASYS